MVKAFHLKRLHFTGFLFLREENVSLIRAAHLSKQTGSTGYLWGIQSTGVHVSLQADLPSCALPEHTHTHVNPLTNRLSI